MGTTITISVLTYALMRSIESLSKIMWKWYRDYKEEKMQMELEDTRRIDR